MTVSKTTNACHSYGTTILRGGRLIKWKGQVASLSPSLGQCWTYRNNKWGECGVYSRQSWGLHMFRCYGEWRWGPKHNNDYQPA